MARQPRFRHSLRPGDGEETSRRSGLWAEQAGGAQGLRCSVGRRTDAAAAHERDDPDICRRWASTSRSRPSISPRWSTCCVREPARAEATPSISPCRCRSRPSASACMTPSWRRRRGQLGLLQQSRVRCRFEGGACAIRCRQAEREAGGCMRSLSTMLQRWSSCTISARAAMPLKVEGFVPARNWYEDYTPVAVKDRGAAGRRD